MLQCENAASSLIRVLVIEDDQGTADEVVAELTSAGFSVEHVANGIDGLRRAMHNEHHVIALDRLLPGMDGLTILAHLRKEQVQTPVLIVSALDNVDERVRGLKAGGDDYLVKPFVPIELSARIEALARRQIDPDGMLLQIGDLVLDLKMRIAVRAGRNLNLAPREVRLLEFLMRRADRIVTRAMLFEGVWNYRFDPGTNLVDVHMGRLRRKVDGQGQLPMIHTIRKTGFRLEEPGTAASGRLDG
jgi:two-component system, OmpR family, response regulator